MNTSRPFRRSRLLATVLAGAFSSLLHAAPVEVSGTGSYSQNFDTLAIDGTDNVWTDDTTIPAWYSNRIVYLASSGSSTSGGLYSFGATETAERALGAQGSGPSGTIFFGVLFQNTSASPVEIDSISYTGEQWRYSGTTAAQTMSFSFATDSVPITDLLSNTYQGVTALDFTSPIISGTTGPLDGNLPANQAALNANVQIIIPPGEFAMLRWEEINHPGNDHGLSVDDLTVTWKPSAGIDIVPPEVTQLVPATGSTDLLVSAVEELTITFNEVVELGTGDILIRRASDNETVLTIDASAQLDFFILENEGIILLPEPSPFEVGESYYVEIPSEAVTDLAGNPFAGFSLSTDWAFNFAGEAQPPIVVINKYSNNPDIVEVLVIGDENPGSTVDMRGMILKDFSGDMAGDGGGSFELAVNDLWSAVPVGTLVSFVADTATSSDIDSSDFTLSVGLNDVAYLTSLGGSFNISNTEMVLIKEAGSIAAGTTGGIHALAGGAEAGSFFINFPGNKLLASNGGTGVIALNSTSTLIDYNGEDAEGGVALAPADFGNPNSGTNSAYIATLRGLIPGDGDGSAIVINTTDSSPFNGLAMFDRGQTGQTATLNIGATIPGVTVTTVEIVVPSELGTPTAGSISLSGPGSAGATFGVTGQTISISSAAITATDTLSVEVGGLATPTPTLVTDNGNYVFVTSTSTSGGTLTPLGQSPAAHVIIPIASLRDINANGVPLDLGATVAVEGVVTEGDFGSGTANFSGFLQDSTAGMNLFSPTANPGLVRGNLYAVVGTLIQFNGLTEIVPSSTASIVDLGASTEPAPVTLTVAELLASAEELEGSLVTITGLTKEQEGTWGTGSNITLQDPEMNDITIRIQSGSTATTEPRYPATITGVFAQFDISNPFFGGYQLLPRDQDDVVGAAGDAYTSWAALNGLTPGVNDGAEQDVEFGTTGDGIANVLEFILGGNPLLSDPSILPVATLDDNNFIFTFSRSEDSIGVATTTFQWSTDLSFPSQNNVLIGAGDSTGPNGVVVDVDETTTPDTVTIFVPRTNAPDGRIQGRLLGTNP